MILLLDIGNTHTHVGLADSVRVKRHFDLPTRDWKTGKATPALRRWVGKSVLDRAVLCSVVPSVTAIASRQVLEVWGIRPRALTSKSVVGVGIDYPRPETIGPDRLSNAIAARALYGCPALVVDFGTAVTFDVVDRRGRYVGGIIAPGLAAMTDYLHEKTALLPRIRIRDVKGVIGKNTEQAMLIGAVHGYRGLVRELIRQLKAELNCPRLPVVATGGYARLISEGLPEITALNPLITLEGLRLFARTP